MTCEAAGEGGRESRMREICTSGLTRGEAETLPYSTILKKLLLHNDLFFFAKT